MVCISYICFESIHLSLETAAFILDKVAPVFNRQGYVGTSLADITKATGLTKGAIYCNFANKEDLALKAFELNVKQAIYPIFQLVEATSGSIAKLYAITTYQRSYYDLVSPKGGCPLLRAGIDTQFINPLLFAKAQRLSEKMLSGITTIIEEGIRNKEIRKDIVALQYARKIMIAIEGSSFLAFTHNDKTFIEQAMDDLNQSVIEMIRI